MARGGTNPTVITTSGGAAGTGRDDTDNQAAVATGLSTVVERMYAWDPVGGNWDRVRINAAGELVVTTSGGTPTGRDDTDNQAAVATGLAVNVGRMYVWDGTGWDRWDRSITDGGGSLTVDGTVALDAPTLAALESITVQNGAGGAAVNIQDGGNSITVDGTVAATQSGAWSVTADTELAPAILLADNMANPTVPQVGAMTMVFDGATWDRWTGVVDLSAASLAALESITVQNGAGAAAVNIQDGGNSITVDGTVALDAGTLAALESITVQNGAGAAAVNIQDGGNSITVDGTVTADTNFDYPEDSGHVSGNPGAFVLAVRNDAGTSLVDATLDYAPLQVNSVGELRVTTSGGAATGRDDTDDQASVSTGLAVGVSRQYVYDGTNWDRQRTGGVTGMTGVAGAEAHDAPITGNPVLMAGRGSAALPTAVSTDGDVTRIWTTTKGVQRVTNTTKVRTGMYYATLSGTVQAAAHAATAGFAWLTNTTANPIMLRKIYFISEAVTTLVCLTAPRITFERMTFTGTPSGTAVTPAKRDSTDAANTATFRTASTGMVITAGAVCLNFLVPATLTGVAATPASFQLWDPIDEYSGIVLRTNEGIVIRQSTAGTAADTRTFDVELIWEEYTE